MHSSFGWLGVVLNHCRSRREIARPRGLGRGVHERLAGFRQGPYLLGNTAKERPLTLKTLIKFSILECIFGEIKLPMVLILLPTHSFQYFRASFAHSLVIVDVIRSFVFGAS